MEETAKGEIIVDICDPFCRRVHENLPQAGDIVLVDVTSNLDRHDTKLFHMVCPSPAGGLPLGNILTSREDEATTSAAITLSICYVTTLHIPPPASIVEMGVKFRT